MKFVAKWMTMGMLAPFLMAQAPQQPAIYASTVYYHVADENRVAYEAGAKDRTRKLFEEVMKADPAVQAATLSRMMYGGNPEPDANYMLTVFYQGVPKDMSAVFEQASQKLFGKSYSEYMKENLPLRKRLGQTLARRIASTPPNLEEGDYIRVDRRKIAQARMGDYLQLERDYLPLREAQVKAGRMKSWSAWAMVLPGGSEREYDAYTSHVAKDLDGALNWGRGQVELNAQLSQPLNLTGLSMRANDVAKIERSDVRRVIMVVRR